MSKQILSQARKQLADLEEEVLEEEDDLEHEQGDDRAPISLKQAEALNKSKKKKKKTAFKLKEDMSDDDDDVVSAFLFYIF